MTSKDKIALLKALHESVDGKLVVYIGQIRLTVDAVNEDSMTFDVLDNYGLDYNFHVDEITDVHIVRDNVIVKDGKWDGI